MNCAQFVDEKQPDKDCFTLPNGECIGDCLLHAVCIAPNLCGKREVEEGSRQPYVKGCHRIADNRIYSKD